MKFRVKAYVWEDGYCAIDWEYNRDYVDLEVYTEEARDSVKIVWLDFDIPDDKFNKISGSTVFAYVLEDSNEEEV